MQGLHKGIVCALLMACSASATTGTVANSDSGIDSKALQSQTAVIAQHTSEQIEFIPGSRRNLQTHEIHVPGASFIKLHFGEFSLPAGIAIEISNPDGSEKWRYSAIERDPFTVDTSRGDDGETRFSAMSISGETARIRLTGDLRRLQPGKHRVLVDSFQEGFPLDDHLGFSNSPNKSKDPGKSYQENACGAEQRYDAACWASDYPWEYARSAAVARLISSRGEVCTAWRVGADNRLFTAGHCLSKQSELDGAEIWFNYEAEICGGSQTLSTVKVAGGSLLAQDRDLDYALFTVKSFSSISSFPAFGLKVSDSELGQKIWIPQHGLGNPRQISLESDMNGGGICEVDALDLDGYVPEADIGYYCDTTTSSSGSPVVDYMTSRVIALHHAGGCLNQGVKMSEIWPQVSGYFGGQVPKGNTGQDGGTSNQPPVAEMQADCDELSCSFDASGSSDPDGSISSFSWEISDGGSSSASSFEYEFQDEGSYQVTLTVEDDEGDSNSQSQTLTLSLPNQHPVANISTNCLNNSCQFNGNGSFDSDGTVTAWDWSLGDGNQAAGEYIDHEYSEAGSYTITLTVEDDEGATESSSRTVTLSMSNQDPMASFNFACTELDCSFDATASNDPDGNIAVWNWDFGDGSTGNGSQPHHSFDADGQYTVSLYIEDNDGGSASQSQAVRVEQISVNENPVASFSVSCNELDCSADATGSSDSDGVISAWSWAFGDGTSASGKNVSHSYTNEGSYTITLSVTDNEGASASTSKSVFVDSPNLAPEADFSFSCDGNRCDFDAGSSVDADGRIVSWRWSFGDGGSASGSTVSHQFSSASSYTVELTVEDDEGAQDSRSRTVTPQQTNSTPNASFSYQCDELNCRFDASKSRDSDGEIVRYVWSLGDGNTATGEFVTHDYSAAGSFTVSLSVEDNQGDTDTRARMVTVTVNEDAPEIVLDGEGGRHNGYPLATLRWSGAVTGTVAIYRGNELLIVTENDRKHLDTEIEPHVRTASYRICQPSGDYCSNQISLHFSP